MSMSQQCQQYFISVKYNMEAELKMFSLCRLSLSFSSPFPLSPLSLSLSSLSPSLCLPLSLLSVCPALRLSCLLRLCLWLSLICFSFFASICHLVSMSPVSISHVCPFFLCRLSLCLYVSLLTHFLILSHTFSHPSSRHSFVWLPHPFWDTP